MRNPLRVRFVRDVALTGGTQVIQAGSAMIAGILVARVLGAEAKGELSVLMALGAMAVILASLGVHQSGVYFLGRFESKRAAVVSNNAIFGLIGGLVTALLLGGLGLAFHDALIHGIRTELFLVFLLSIPLNYFNEFGRRVLLGVGRVASYNLPDLLTGISLLVGTAVALLAFGSHLMPLVVLRVLSELVIFTFVVARVGRLVRWRLKPSRQVLNEQMAYGVKNYASSLLWIVLLQGDLVLCNHFLGNHETGIYSVAVSLGLPITLLGAVVGTLIFQRVSSEDTERGRIEMTNRVFRVLIVVLAVVVVALGVAAHWIVPIVYGDAFDPAVTALILLLPGLFALALELVLMNFLAGNGSPPMVYIAPAIGLIVNFGANMYAIPHWGINGASVTSSVGYAVVLALVAWYYLRMTGAHVRDLILVRRVDIRLAGFGSPRPVQPEA
jgi:O-antigen/teichoic acid export membrane protein